MLLGDLIVGWQLLSGALTAAAALEKIYAAAQVAAPAERRALARENSEAAFYEGKIASARYFATTVLPTIKGRALGILAGDRTPVEMLDLSFG